MFNDVERQEILDSLIDMFKSRDDISTVILVGSASYGFRDEYSDIDYSNDGLVFVTYDHYKTFYEITN